MEINVKNATERLAEINNQLTLLMKEKKAIQHYIEEENNRLIGSKSFKTRAYELREDPEFIKKNRRKRYYWEIGNIVGYSEKTIKRLFKEDEEIEKDLSK